MAETSERNYGTGKRKDAVARVWLQAGSGSITINNKPMDEYFPRMASQQWVLSPLRALESVDKYDIVATAKGGGINGQAGAVRHGIAKALLEMDPENRVALRGIGALTRDPRVKERKKYGRKRARRGFQFSKR